MNKQLVFVYGTLKRGYGNHRNRLDGDGATFKGAFKTEEKFNMRALGYPYVSKTHTDENNNNIQGELWEVTDELLKGPLDRLEGHPDYYKREKTSVVNNKGEKCEAWLYFYNHKGTEGDAIPSGNFDDYAKNR
jgi:gamma-glutamylaminecyclotransferase